ncbi:MAG: TonB-dependent receptor [Putridiphycobacter sp.]
MKSILILLFFLLLCFNGFSQTDIVKGKVIQKNAQGNYEPTPGVILKSVKNLTFSKTNINGNFEIKINQFPDTITVSNLGFQTQFIYVTKPLNELVIEMKPGKMLTTVTVVGKNDGKFMDLLSARYVEKIGQNELRKAACCNLSESFETNASVDVNLTDAVSGAKKIQMLGLDGIYTQLQWENIPLVRGLSTSYGLNFVPGTWIESIQITKGTGSVVNGYESLAGLINLSLKNPTVSKDKFYINSYGNSFGRGEINLHGVQTLKPNWKTMNFLSLSNNFMPVDRNKDGFYDIPLGYSGSFFSRWVNTGDNYEARFGIKGAFTNQHGGQINQNDQQPNYDVNFYSNYLELFSKNGFFIKDRRFASIGLITQAKFHYLKNTFGPTVYEGTQRKLYFNGIYSDIIGNTNHNYKTGLSFILDDYNQSYMDSSFLKTEVVPGVFFEYTFSRDKIFTLVAGIRGDYHNLFGPLVAPRLHAKWNINPKSALRLSAGRGLRVPNPYADYTSLMASSRVWFVDAQLKPEDAFNTGITFTQKFLVNDLMSSFSVDYFYTHFFNQLIVDRDISANEIHLYNSNGTSFSHSFQAEINIKPIKQLELRSAFKYYNVQAEFNGVLQQKPFVPKFRALLNAGFTTRNKKWMFDLTGNWIGQKRLPSTESNPSQHQRPNETVDFWLLNTQLTYKYKKFSVYLGGENLLNIMQDRAIISVDDPLGNYFDATQIWAPISGFKLYAGLHYTIEQKNK